MLGPTLLALCAGAMLPIQAAMNGRLARSFGSSIWAAAFSGALLTVCLVIFGVLALRVLPRTEGAAALPWWAWTGGFCGCVLLTATTFCVPRLGAATMVALVIAGQVICSMVLDKYGLLGLPVTALTPRRLAAGLLLIMGAVLIR